MKPAALNKVAVFCSLRPRKQNFAGHPRTFNPLAKRPLSELSKTAFGSSLLQCQVGQIIEMKPAALNKIADFPGLRPRKQNFAGHCRTFMPLA